jgi:DNA-directed RNA polymerase specialized sigma24 family protein
MERPGESSIEVLDRLRPVLLAVFRAFQISEEKAREIVEEAGAKLASKRRKPQDPDAWLLRTVIEQCRRAREEAALEDPSD